MKENSPEADNAKNKAEYPMTFYETLSIVAQFFIFVATATYAYFAWDQWKAIHHQADIATRTLLLTQRPKLRIRNVAVTPIPLADNSTRLLKQGIGVTFSIINVGNAVAQIRKGDCLALFASNPLPMPPLYAERPPSPAIGNTSLQPGEVHQVSLHYGQPLDDTQQETWKVHFERLYVMGYIDYVDELNLTRRTAFCRRLTANTRYFVAEENPDYEYED